MEKPSSFRKRTSAPSSSNTQESALNSEESNSNTLCNNKIIGLKPWINGGYLVSSGNRELDSFIGGGIGIGTVLMIETDSVSNYGDTLLAYSMAQAISSGHRTIVITSYDTDPKEFAATLPFNRNASASQDKQPDSSTEGKLGKEQHDNRNKDNGSAETTSTGLKIAWQYEKYIKDKIEANKTKTEASSESYCCSYDLSRRLQPSVYESNMPIMISMEDLSDSPSTDEGDSVLDKTLSRIHAALSAIIRPGGSGSDDVSSTRPRTSQVHRIFIPHLAQMAAEYGFTQRGMMSIVRFILGVKQIVREASASASLAFTVCPQTCPDMLIHRLKWVADSVLSVESFAGKQDSVPYELAEYCGLLAVEKLQQVGAIASFRPSGSKFGLKRDARKLSVEPLHLSPEESRAFGDAGKCTPTASAASSAAARAGEHAAAASSVSVPASVPVSPGQSEYANEQKSTALNKRGHLTISLDKGFGSQLSPKREIHQEKSFFNIPIAPPSPEINTRTLETAPPRTPSKYEEKGVSGAEAARPINPRARDMLSRAKLQQSALNVSGASGVQMPRPVGIAGVQSLRQSPSNQKQNKGGSGSLDF